MTVAPAGAAEGNQIVEIENVAYRQCLRPSTPHPHSALAFGDCSGAADQRWELIPLGGGHHVLRNLASAECVSDKSGHYYCDDEEATARVELVPGTDGSTRFKFGEEYLTGFTNSDGRRDARIIRFADTDERRWRVRQVGTTTPVDTTGQVVRIRTVNTAGDCVILRNGSRIAPQPCASSPEERFQRIELPNGSTALRSLVNGKCVAPKEGSRTGMQVVADCAPDDSRQHFTIEPTKTGAVRIRYTADQRYFTPSSEVVLYERQRNVNTWQLWDLLPA